MISLLFAATMGGIGPAAMGLPCHTHEDADTIQEKRRYEGRQVTNSQENYLRTGRDIAVGAVARLGLCGLDGIGTEIVEWVEKGPLRPRHVHCIMRRNSFRNSTLETWQRGR